MISKVNVGRRAARSGSGFTLIELLVVIAIIAILAAILFPVFAKAREKAKQASCLSNTKQLGLGIMQYMQDFDEVLPMGAYNEAYSTPVPVPAHSSRWYDDIYIYVKSLGVFVCPSDNVGTSFNPPLRQPSTSIAQLGPSTGGAYGCNINIMPFDSAVPVSKIASPAGTFIIAEAAQMTNAKFYASTYSDPTTWWSQETGASDWQMTPPSSFTGTLSTKTAATYFYAYGFANQTDTNYTRLPVGRHNGGLNVIYCDGHAKWSMITDFLGTGTNSTNPGKLGWDYGDPHNSWDDQ